MEDLGNATKIIVPNPDVSDQGLLTGARTGLGNQAEEVSALKHSRDLN